MEKLVYKDAEFVKVLRGKLLSEDDLFVIFICDDNVYRISKREIISIRMDKDCVDNG